MVATQWMLRLARAPAVKTAAATTAVRRSAHHMRSRAVRCFSNSTGNGNDDDDNDNDDNDNHDLRYPNGLHNGMNGDSDVNPFERLLQHSQQFREQLADAEQHGLGVEDVDAMAEATEALEQEQAVGEREQNDDDDSSSSSSSSSSDSDSSSSSDSDSDSDSDDDSYSTGRFSTHQREQRKPTGRNAAGRPAPSQQLTPAEREHRAARAARSVRRRILNAPDDALDYEHALSNNLSVGRAKERKYQQVLHRQQDKDRVCRNCGERGHVAKHCLLPMICSNCGGIGHRMRDCVHPVTTTVEDAHASLAHEKTQRKQQLTIERQRSSKRLATFQHELDAQIDEYLEHAAMAAEKRRMRKAEKLAAMQEDDTSQDAFKPVVR